MRSGAWAVPLALAAAGCSLTGLDDFPVFDCAREGGDTACDPLNQAEGIGEGDCRRWQCEEQSGRCVLRARRDDDEDGYAAAACGGDDCDDADPETAPGLEPVVRTVLEGVGEASFIRWGAAADDPALAFGDGTRQAFVRLPGSSEARPAGNATDVDADDHTDPAVQDGCALATLTAPACLSDPVGTGVDTCQTHEECQDGDYCNGLERCAPADLGTDARGCKTEGPTCGGAGETCDPDLRACRGTAAGACTVAALATAPLGDRAHLAAAVGTDGCEAGTLRIGWIAEGEPDLARGVPGPSVLCRGPDRRTPAFYGVDLVGSGAAEGDAVVSCSMDPPDPSAEPDARCTGGSRSDGSPRGVASVRAAALPSEPDLGRRRPQGLLAWLAAPHCRGVGACGAAEPAAVEVIGAWQEEMLGRDGVPIVWTTVSDDGAPRALASRATGRRGPCVAAVGGVRAGYVVAFAAGDGGIAATWVPALEDPPEVGDTAPYRTALATSARTTPALAPASEGRLRVGMTVGEVDAAAAEPDAGRAAVGLAWIEDGSPWFGRAEVATSTGTITEGSALRLADGPASEPSIVYSPVACGPGCPGWAVAFVTDGAVHVARLGAEGTMAGPPVRLGGRAARTPRPVVTGGGALAAAWHEPDEGTFVRSSSVCPPR